MVNIAEATATTKTNMDAARTALQDCSDDELFEIRESDPGTARGVIAASLLAARRAKVDNARSERMLAASEESAANALTANELSLSVPDTSGG